MERYKAPPLVGRETVRGKTVTWSVDRRSGGNSLKSGGTAVKTGGDTVKIRGTSVRSSSEDRKLIKKQVRVI